MTSIHLRLVPPEDLQQLAQSLMPPSVAEHTLPSALPPDFVARRALQHLADGKPPQWCSTYYMVRNSDGVIVGSCGFKDAPAGRRVEIGYGVAPEARRQGVATAAVQALLAIGAASGEVDEILAQVNPDNIASNGVVRHCGFTALDIRCDDDGEQLMQWLATVDD